MFWRRKASPALDTRNIVVSIYSKPGCHLCEQAKEQLIDLQRRHGFQLEEVDISRDAKLLAEFETRIPLIWVNNHLVCKYRVEEQKLLSHLQRAVGGKVANDPE